MLNIAAGVIKPFTFYDIKRMPIYLVPTVSVGTHTDVINTKVARMKLAESGKDSGFVLPDSTAFHPDYMPN